MKKFETYISKLNYSQKIILTIMICLGLFILFYILADSFDGTYKVKPFLFTNTWWIWLVYFIIFTFIGLKIFEQKI